MDPLTARYLLRHADGGADLAGAITAVAAGEVASAAELLAGVVGDSADPAVRVRAAAYHRLATHLRWNAFPGGSGAAATEISVRWDATPSDVEAGEDWAALTGQLPDPATVVEARVVSGVLCALPSARMVVDFAAARSEAAEVDARLADALRFVAPLRDVSDPSLRAYADVTGADLARRARRPEQAAQLLRDAAAAYGAAGDMVGLAACHVARGDWRAAPAASPESRNLTLVASAAHSSALDWTLESQEAGLAGFDADAAAAAYAEAEDALRDAGDAGAAGDAAVRGLAAAALRRGHLAALAGDHAEAERQAGLAAQRSEDCGDRWGGWLARTHEALAAVGDGRLTEGTRTAEQVGRWGATTGSFSHALGLGLLCARSGRDWLYRHADAERALAAHRLARTLFAALGAVTDESQSLVDRGGVLQVLGDDDGAGAAYEEALDLLSADLAARPAAAGDNRLRAVPLAQSLYLLALRRRDATGMARSAERLAVQVERLPQDPDEESIEGMLAAAASDTLAQAAVLVPVYRAEDARDAGDTEAAEVGFSAALDVVHAVDTPDADFLEAVVLGHARRYPEASSAFHRYLERQAAPRTGLVGRMLSRFGPMKAELERAQQNLHEQAAAFFRRLRDHPASVSHFEALERRGGDRWWARLERPWELLTDYGAACEGLGELPRALALHEQAITELESRRARLRRDELKTALSGTTGAAAVYLAAARTALRMSEDAASAGDTDEAHALTARAFAYAERGRARGLLDLLGASAGLARSAPVSRDAVRAWHQANSELSLQQGLLAAEQGSPHPDPGRLAALRDAITAAEAELFRREADLERDDPAFAATVAVPVGVLSLDEVAAALPPGAALLTYHHLDEDLLAWALTRDGVAATHLASVDAAALARDVRAFTQACEAGGRDLGGQKLTATLLEPFGEVVERCHRLVVVPPSGAHAMPFHALPWRDGPLLAQHVVSYLPSASSLQFLRRDEAEPPDRVLAVGDPSGMVWQALPGQVEEPAKSLPGAATEAAFVAALFGDARLLVGEKATEAVVRAEIGGYRVVHLATHGQVSEQAPLLSSVLLAGGEALSVYELMGIHLDADLVVLSACHTGTGRATAGGDVLGMTRGLLGAGARGVVVTLWATDDEASCVLMANFYRRLRGGAPPAVAIQRAQGYLRRMRGHSLAAEFAAIREAVADPAGASDLLAPIDPDDEPEQPQTRGRHASWWAPFSYVGL